MKGGKSYFDLENILSSNIYDILNDKYTGLMEQGFFRRRLNICTSDTDYFNETMESYNYEGKYVQMCFEKEFNESEKLLIMEKAYKLKKKLTNEVTDLCMNTISINENKILCNFIHFSFDYTIKYYVDYAIREQTYGNISKYLYNKIIWLYKGGNTTRYHMNAFIKSVKDRLGDRSKDILENIMSGWKIGDYDYSVYIKYQDLKDKGFRDDQLLKLKDDLKKMVMTTLNYLKNKLEKYFNGEELIKNLSGNIQRKYFNGQFERELLVMLNDINETSKNKLEMLELDNIVITGGVIDKTGYYMDYNRDTTNTSKIFFNLGNKYMGNDNKIVSQHKLITTNKMYSSDELAKNLPNYMDDSNIYILYVDNLKLNKGPYNLSDFDLYRLKINTVFNFNVIRENSPFNVKKNKQVAIEIIDVSINGLNDSRRPLYEQFSYGNEEDIINIDIGNINKMNKIRFKIPSPHYMYKDLATMLFTDAMFVWEDKKYAKRIKRFLYQTLICLTSDKIITTQILDKFNTIKESFTDMQNLVDIDDKLSYISPYVNVIDHPQNDEITEIFNNTMKRNINDFDIKQLVFNNPSKYANCHYIEHVLLKYIEMLVVGNYLLTNRTNYGSYCSHKLKFLYLLDNREHYFNTDITTTIYGLSTFYKNFTGTTRVFNTIPDGLPMNGFIRPDILYVDKFVGLIQDFETDVINILNDCIIILQDMVDNNIVTIDIKYDSDSLF